VMKMGEEFFGAGGVGTNFTPPRNLFR
jgi:hypothetical protein